MVSNIPISVEPNQNMYRRNKIEKDKRDLLLEDTYHITDSAYIFQVLLLIVHI